MDSIVPPHEMKSSAIPFESLTPDDMRMVNACADRVLEAVKNFFRSRSIAHDNFLDRDVLLIRMDVALVKIRRDVNLYQWLLSSDLDFFSDWIAIQGAINRVDGTVSNDVKLRFASIGANFTTH